MIKRETLATVKNILSLHNENLDLNAVYNIMTAIQHNDTLSFLKNILPLSNKDIDINLLENVFSSIVHHPDLEEDILDSFSVNQFKSKTALLDAVEKLNILDSNSTVVIWGCWYGSILIPALANKVKKIAGIDLNETVLKIAKNKFFTNFNNVEFIVDDAFKTYRDIYLDTNLIINTSCEHMAPMKEWPWFKYSSMETDTIYPKGYGDNNPSRKKVFKAPKLSSNCYFAFQSNNMFGIEGHVNCVNSLQEFKDQMPERAEILFEEEVEDTRGTRYMLVGKLTSI